MVLDCFCSSNDDDAALPELYDCKSKANALFIEQRHTTAIQLGGGTSSIERSLKTVQLSIPVAMIKDYKWLSVWAERGRLAG